MRVREIIKTLQKSGVKVEYKDYGGGKGVYITSISSKKYSGSTGNKVARELLGIEYDKSLIEQRRYAAIEKQRQIREPSPKVDLSKEVLKEFRKTQRLWRENEVKGHGKITQKKLKQHIARFGSQSAIETLRKEQRYAKGYAYDENVQHLIDMLYGYMPDTQELIDIIESKRSIFKESWIQEILDIFYMVDAGRTSLEEGIRLAEQVIS